MKRKKIHCIFSRTFPFIPAYLGALFPHGLVAQDDAVDEDVFLLSAFEVETSRDVGYLSTNAVSGTSLNMAIRDIPIPIEVINQEFITDLHATDAKEALLYSAGVYQTDFRNNSGANAGGTSAEISPSTAASLNNAFTNTIQIRGYNVPNQQRLGFRVGSIVPKYNLVLGGLTDTANTNRQEVVRGPASLLYGINVLSGIVNIIPKKPLGEPLQSVTISVGSDDFMRSSVDLTGPLIRKRLNYRLIGAHHEEGDWTDYRKENRDYLAGQLEWFISSSAKLFLEAQYGDVEIRGFGPKFFRDNLSGAGVNNVDVRNPYYEPFTWGLDFTPEDANRFLSPKDGKAYTFPNLGDSYRISGPDTRYTREEVNFLGLLTVEPMEDLIVELGAYFTSVEENNFTVDLKTFTDTSSVIRPREGMGLTRTHPITGVVTVIRPNEFRENPEYDDNDPKGFGPGELFVVPNLVDRLDGIESTWEDRKFAYYQWYNRPSSVDTWQLRGKFAYSFDTPVKGVDLRHTLTSGYQYILDKVEFVEGGPNLSETYTVGRLAEDPIYFRNIFDYSPLRYDGQTLAIPGRISESRLGAPANELRNVARSGWLEADLEYHGMYAIYQAQVWNDRLTFIGGWRRDTYQVTEREHLRVLDTWVDSELGTTLTNQHQGTTEFAVLDKLIGFGDKPYVPDPDLPDALNESIARDVDLIRSFLPNGTVEDNFTEPQVFESLSGGLNFRLTDSVSLYAQYSEGVFPNTGQRDGAFEPIGAEETNNKEIGLKFDFFDGKISGTISYYIIERKNAVYRWNQAPNPSSWYGGLNGPSWDTFTKHSFFDPAAARGEEGAAKGDAPLSYGVAQQYVQQAFDEFGLGSPPIGSGDPVAKDLGISVVTELIRQSKVEPQGTDVYYFVPYALLEEGGVMKRAFDLAMQDRSYEGSPISYAGGPEVEKFNNPSNTTGANVTFREEATGFDGQIIFSPIDNYQILFSFSHQEREVVGNGFNLVAPVDVRTGETYSTEYDQWVYILGTDAFEDPKDPTTTNGKGVNGLDLSFTPKLSLSLWNKYSFREGAFKGLELAGGLRYSGSAPTSIPIGGNSLDINRFPTPDTKERFVFDTTVNYSFDWLKTRFRLSLGIRNLFDDTYSENIVEYPDGHGGVETRRSRILYDPRSWRLSLTATF